MTTDALYLTDRNGLPLSTSTPVRGNHNDLFTIEKHFAELIDSLYQSSISVNGPFLNFDAEFDAENLRAKALELGITDFNKFAWLTIFFQKILPYSFQPLILYNPAYTV